MPWLTAKFYWPLETNRRLDTTARRYIDRPWIELNCLNCEFRDRSKDILDRLAGRPEEEEVICKFPGHIKSVGGYCWPGDVNLTDKEMKMVTPSDGYLLRKKAYENTTPTRIAEQI